MFDQLYILARGGVCIHSGPPSTIPTIDPDSRYPIEPLIKHSCFGHQNAVVQELVERNNVQFTNSRKLVEETQLVPNISSNRVRFSLYATRILLARYVTFIKGHQWGELLSSALLLIFVAQALIWFYDIEMFNYPGCFDLTDGYGESCFGSLAEKEYDMVNDATKYIYFFIVSLLILSLLQAAFTFQQDLVLFENEHRNGWYSSGSFYLMKSIIEMLLQIPIILLVTYIFDHYEHIRPGIYWSLVGLFILSVAGFQAIGHIFALISRGNMIILILLCMSAFLVFSILSNLIVQISTVHYVFAFASNFSIIRFTHQVVHLLLYGFGRCTSNETEVLLFRYSLVDDDLVHSVAMLAFNLIFYQTVAFWLLVRKVQSSKRLEKTECDMKYEKMMSQE